MTSSKPLPKCVLDYTYSPSLLKLSVTLTLPFTSLEQFLRPTFNAVSWATVILPQIKLNSQFSHCAFVFLCRHLLFLVTLGSKLMPLNSLIHSNFGPSLLTTKPCHSNSQKPLSEYRNRAPCSPPQGSTTQEAVVVNTLCWKHDYSAEKEN